MAERSQFDFAQYMMSTLKQDASRICFTRLILVNAAGGWIHSEKNWRLRNVCRENKWQRLFSCLLQISNPRLRLLEAVLQKSGLVWGRPHPTGFGPSCNKGGLKREISGWISGIELMIDNEWQFFGQSGKTRVQHTSRHRYKSSSGGDAITSCGSLFHGETARTAKEFSLAAASAAGFVLV